MADQQAAPRRNQPSDFLILEVSRGTLSKGTNVLNIVGMVDDDPKNQNYRRVTCFPDQGSDDLTPFVGNGFSFLLASLYEPEKMQRLGELADQRDTDAILQHLKEEILPLSKTIAETLLSGDDEEIEAKVAALNEPFDRNSGEGGIVGRIVRAYIYERPSSEKDGKTYRNFAISGFNSQKPNEIPRTLAPVMPSNLDQADQFGSADVSTLIEQHRSGTGVGPTPEEAMAEAAAMLAPKKASTGKKSVPFN